jgi:malonate decarboxylase epsilon subunit
MSFEPMYDGAAYSVAATTVLQEVGCNLFFELLPRYTFSGLARENLCGVNLIPVEAGLLPRIVRVVRQKEANT